MNEIKLEFDSGGRSHGAEIVSLLKASLGESLMPKSIEFWRWKHIENPFGESPVLLALDDKKIVGVRALMQWRWQKEETILRALRAVDTAVDPAYQGRRLFTKLTTQLIGKCQQDGFDMIFNTPNNKSLPGYLKMGWVNQGEMRVGVRPRVMNSIKNLFVESSENIHEEEYSLQSFLNSNESILLFSSIRKTTGFQTPMTMDYFRWRYITIPVAKYLCWFDPHCKLLIVFRIKGHKLRELRIVDWLSTSDLNGKELSQKFSQFFDYSKRLRPSFISIAGSHPAFLSLRRGPIITTRKVKDDFNESFFVSNWSPSLGDMELF